MAQNQDRFISTFDGQPGLHYLCEGYQLFFRHIDLPMRGMADLLRRGQDATESGRCRAPRCAALVG